MCHKDFQNIDYIDCKMVPSEIKKRIFFLPSHIDLVNFGSSWPKI